MARCLVRPRLCTQPKASTCCRICRHMTHLCISCLLPPAARSARSSNMHYHHTTTTSTHKLVLQPHGRDSGSAVSSKRPLVSSVPIGYTSAQTPAWDCKHQQRAAFTVCH